RRSPAPAARTRLCARARSRSAIVAGTSTKGSSGVVVRATIERVSSGFRAGRGSGQFFYGAVWPHRSAPDEVEVETDPRGRTERVRREHGLLTRGERHHEVAADQDGGHADCEAQPGGLGQPYPRRDIELGAAEPVQRRGAGREIGATRADLA